MIWEKDYTKLVFSNQLEKKHPKFWKELSQVLTSADLDYEITETFPDLWLRDYLGIQASIGKMISFKYSPRYMKHESTLPYIQKAKTDFESNNVIHSSLVLDGGNCVFNSKYIVICERVFKENKRHSKKAIIKEIRKHFGERNVIIIPDLPGDEFGHADGLVRFIDDDSVFIQNMRNSFSRRLKKQLVSHGLNVKELPWYNHYKISGNERSAKGFYINYLRVGNKVLIPQFEVKQDNTALSMLQNHFGSENVFPVNCNDIAAQGGVLNCCSWTC